MLTKNLATRIGRIQMRTQSTVCTHQPAIRRFATQQSKQPNTESSQNMTNIAENAQTITEQAGESTNGGGQSQSRSGKS